MQKSSKKTTGEAYKFYICSEPDKNDLAMMIGKVDVAEQLHQFFFSLLKHLDAPAFIRENRLWQGFWHYGWVTRMLVVIALMVGLKMFSIVWGWWGQAELDNLGGAVNSMGMLIADFATEGFNYLFMGGMKYVILILMEVLVFHFCRRTMSILLKKDGSATFDDFFKAQLRMIRVGIRSWIRESIITLLIGIALGIVDTLAFAEPVLIFAVQCYYLGFTVVDNYNEQFGLSVKDSARLTYEKHLGVALGIGLVLNILLFIPVLGAVAGPLLSAVTATLVMYELSDLHLPTQRIAAAPDDSVV